MPRPATRVSRRIMLSVVEDRPLQVLGLNPAEDGATQVWSALCRYSELIDRAARDLDLSRAEWNMIADLLNGCADLWDYSGTRLPSGLLLIAELEDGQKLDGTGDKWLGDGQGDAGVRGLVRRLRKLTSAHHDAITAAVRWFWSHHESIDHTVDEWWTVEFRTRVRADAGLQS